MPVHDKVALVTGGASGIGRASARLLARHGARVVVCDVDAERAAQVAREIGGLSCPCDVGDSSAVAKMAKDVLAAFGTVDVLVNSAGTNLAKRALAELTNDAFDQ